MGCSLLALLYLQMTYIREMTRMRKEQFDESVLRSLDRASRSLEQNETFRYLEQITMESELYRKEIDSLDYLLMMQGMSGLGANAGLTSAFKLKTTVKHPSRMPKSLTIKSKNSISEASKAFQQFVKNAYVYQKGLLDEVIYSILYTASNRPLEERVNFKLLDQDIRSALESNGVHIPYHFVVMTSDGREVYRCPYYEEK